MGGPAVVAPGACGPGPAAGSGRRQRVALAGVGFLAVATYHIANTFLHEEDEGQIYAALPVPALSHANNGLLRFAHGDPLLIVGNLDGTASDWDAVSDDSQGVIRASDPARGVETRFHGPASYEPPPCCSVSPLR